MSRFFFRCGITALSLLTVTRVLVAAEEPRSRQHPDGAVEERFRQFDRNGDGNPSPLGIFAGNYDASVPGCVR